LSTEYINNSTKYSWECSDKHQWKSTASSLQQGSWCPYCAGCAKKNIKHLHELASEKNGRCLSDIYINIMAKYQWECNLNHRWEATASSVQRGAWCPCCAGFNKNNIKWLHELASENNGRCLSIAYVNTKTKYQWECNLNHRWEAVANNIQQNKWCPTCAKTNDKAQTEVYDFVKQFYPDALYNVTGLLKSKKLELDVYIPSLKKAIELDGEYWHSMPGAAERDLRKNIQCSEAGIQLLRVPYVACWYDKSRKIGERMIMKYLNLQ
jgi:thiol-disulfide isomerase/thioredoxin